MSHPAAHANPRRWGQPPSASSSAHSAPARDLQQALQIAVGILAAMGTLLLGMGSDNVVLPAAAIFVAVTSVYFTDRLGWIRLNRYVASLAAIGAVCIAVSDFFELDRDRQLLAIAYLLIYLQIVLMYQQKDVRIYWQLFMLSLLQVVVASALNFSMLFGFLLVLYMFVALFAQALFFLVREQARMENLVGQSASVPNVHARLVSGQPLFDLTESAMDHSPPDATVRRRLWVRIGKQGVATLAATLLVFFLLPRISDNSPIRQIAMGRMVGFSERVTLGQLGTIMTNPAGVMRVRFIDPKSGDPYTIHDTPLFRGAVVNHYEGRAWSLQFQSSSVPIPLQSVRPLLARHPSIVYQSIELEPSRTRTIFSIAPTVARTSDHRIAYDANRQQLIRVGSRQSKLRIELATRGLRFGMQTSTYPVDTSYDRIDDQDLLQLPKSQKGVDPLQSLKQAAREVLAQADLPASDVIGRARALEHYLHSSGRFRYSLTAPVRDRSLDPVEDFIRNNPQGHCEYFASALTLMLRSQGIPARMVIGFQGGEWNSLGGYYQVRQLHAHTWVEALVQRRAEDPSHRNFPGDDPRYVWLRLDPTTGVTDDPESGATSPWTDQFREWRNYADFLWSNYVVDLNARRQSEGIYEPLAAKSETVGQVFSKSFWTESVPNYVASVFKGDAEDDAQTGRFGWQHGLVLLLGLLLAIGAWRWLAMRINGALPRLWHRRRSRGAATEPSTVAFYRRFEALVQQHGMVRSPNQTPREFALAVGQQIAQRPQQNAATTLSPPLPPPKSKILNPKSFLPCQIVEILYQVRYGHKVLDKEERDTVEQSLCQLKRILQVNT